MKRKITFPVLMLSLLGLSVSSGAQDEKTLPEVRVTATNYKYIKAVDNKDLAQPVKLLERQAAAYDVKNSEMYQDDYETYSVTFYLPEGYVLAVYDQDGKLLRTAERFKNIALPTVVSKAVAQKYPGWAITKDVYLVSYEDGSGAEKLYKLVLENNNKHLRVKVNEKGEFK